MKLINYLDLKQKFWIQRDDESPGTYNVNKESKFKTKMLKSIFLRLQWCLHTSIWNYSCTAAKDDDSNDINQKIILKKFAPSKNWLTEINNPKVHNEDKDK